MRHGPAFPPRPATAPLDVFHGGRHDRDVREIAEIHSLEGDGERALRAVMSAARTLGADGVIVIGHHAVEVATVGTETVLRCYGPTA